MGPDQINIILGIILSILPYFILAFVPVWDQLRFSRKTVVLLGFFAISLNILSVLVIMAFFPNWLSLRFFHSLFFLVLYIGLYLILVRGAGAKLLFIALLIKSYADFVVNLAKFFELNLPVGDDGSYSLYFNLFQGLILLPTYPLVWLFFRGKVRQVVQTYNKAWRFLWIVPLVYYIISLAFAAMDLALIAQWQFLVFNLTAFFGFLLIYYVVIMMLEQAEENVILSEKNKIMGQQLVLQKRYYQKFGDWIDVTRKSEHDLKHHLNTLKGLIDHGQIKKAELYIDTLVDGQADLATIRYCQNDALNALLGYYGKLCDQEAISLKLVMVVPAKFFVDDLDLCVVVGNLLENAIEASRKIASSERSIKAAGQVVGKQFYLTVDNYFNGQVKMRNGDYLSSKRRNTRGVGLSSVADTVRKYQGQADFQAEAGVFKASVMMQAQALS